MRNFNEEERAILLKIVSPKKNPFPDISRMRPIMFMHEYRYDVGELFFDIAFELECQIEVNFSKETMLFLFQYTPLEKIGDKYFSPKGRDDNKSWRNIFDLQNKTTTLITLLDYLEKNHLIYYYKMYGLLPGQDENGDEIPTVFNNELALKGHVQRAGLSKQIEKWFFSHHENHIFPSYELEDFVVNNFRDKEQIRHEDNIRMQEKTLEQANRST